MKDKIEDCKKIKSCNKCSKREECDRRLLEQIDKSNKREYKPRERKFIYIPIKFWK